jgi:hypothetical protein
MSKKKRQFIKVYQHFEIIFKGANSGKEVIAYQVAH